MTGSGRKCVLEENLVCNGSFCEVLRGTIKSFSAMGFPSVNIIGSQRNCLGSAQEIEVGGEN